MIDSTFRSRGKTGTSNTADLDRKLAEIAEITASGLFDVAYYIDESTDGTLAEDTAVAHFCRTGWHEKRNPNRYFHTAWYVQQMPDADRGILNPLLHYIRTGERQGLRPTLFFDPVSYRERYGLDAGESPLRHFLTPANTGRFSPLPEFRGDTIVHFDPNSPADQIGLLRRLKLIDEPYYVDSNSGPIDGEMDPAEHFFRIGAQQGRNPNYYFDTAWYLAHNPQAAGVQPLLHYALVGEKAGCAPSRLFDPTWYRRTYKLAADEGALSHYLFHCIAGLVAPLPEFDVSFYLANYPDVAAAMVDPFRHFLAYGYREGRRPSNDFDTQAGLQHSNGGDAAQAFLGYLEQKKAAAASRLAGRWGRGASIARSDEVSNQTEVAIPPSEFVSRMVDFRTRTRSATTSLSTSATSPRDVRPASDTRGAVAAVSDPAQRTQAQRVMQLEQVIASGLFDTAHYMRTYPDVTQSGADPLEHFFDFGFSEGRWPNPYFDPSFYLAQNEDVRVSKMQPLFHYVALGDREGRRPSALFDTAWYRGNYGIAAEDLALAHYLAGRKSGRLSPMPDFDAAFYCAQYPDIASAGVDPFEHFFHYGWREARNPSADFDVEFYVRRYLGGTFEQNPFAHFLAHRHDPGVHGRMPETEATIPREIRRFTHPGADFEECRPLSPSAPRQAKLLAYYLPQFHAFPENDVWWGKGFTEWTNISRGVPRFQGHYQPRIPRDLGFYSLDEDAVFRRQVDMARAGGVFGFVFYYYWFNGKRLMHRPVERFLTDATVKMPFCLMWANENWTRRWDGAESEVLISQDYRADDDEAMAADFTRHFADPRYIRLQGRPLLMIYRPVIIPDAAKKVARWRSIFRDLFKEDPLLVMAQSFDDTDPRPYGLDGAIEFPPHKLTQRARPINASLELLDQEFRGKAYSYDDVVTASLDESPPPYPLIKTAIPSWDNDARRQGTGVVITGSTPAKYEAWLARLARTAAQQPFFGEKIICVNAWNEWCEGAYLEPDLHFGAAYLNATARAVSGIKRDVAVPKLVLVGHDAFPSGAQLLLLNIGRALQRYFGMEIEFLLLGGGKLEAAYREVAPLTVAADDLDAEKTLKALVGRGFCHAIVNTTAAARITGAACDAGIEPVVLVHELPRIIREKQLGVGLAAAVAQARRLIFPSVFVRDQLLGEADAPTLERAQILPQGIYQDLAASPEGAEAVRREFGVLPDDYLILGAGYADLRKGFDLFQQLWRQLHHAALPGRVHLVWAGGIDPGLKDWLGDEIATATATGTFHMAGYRSDMAALFSAADGFALTSREDPYPSVVLEALSLGVRAFAFDGSGGIPDLLREVQSSGVIPYGDVGAMAAAMVAVLGERSMPDERAARSARFAARFAFRPYVRKLIDQAIPDFAAVSVVVPNYNYAHCIPERLASIFHQSHPVHEVVVLDDCSTDDSLRVIPLVAAEWRREIQLVPNAENSGSVFAQWRRGAELATGEFVWIAEADDLCERDFLARLLPLMAADPAVQLAFADSRTINVDGSAQWATYKSYYATVAAGALARTEVFDGAAFAGQLLSVKNLILNASAVIWRRDALLRCLDACAADLQTFRMAGDWRLYLEALAPPGARIAYEAEPLNVHRRHAHSVTHALAAERHADEIARCQGFARAAFDLPAPARTAQDSYLSEVRTQLGLAAPGASNDKRPTDKRATGKRPKPAGPAKTRPAPARLRPGKKPRNPLPA